MARMIGAWETAMPPRTPQLRARLLNGEIGNFVQRQMPKCSPSHRGPMDISIHARVVILFYLLLPGGLMPNSAGHSKAEIVAKLARADELARHEKLQREIARTLGVSVMTLRRWRKMPLARTDGQAPLDQIAELELENARLQRLATCFLRS